MAAVAKIDVNANENSQNLQITKREIANILEKILKFKERVGKYIDDNYVDFMPTGTTPYLDLEEGKLLEKEGYDKLVSLEWAYGDVELESSILNLKKSVWDLDATNRILAADELFQCLEETKSSNEYLMTLDLLKKINDLIHGCANEDVQTIFYVNPCYDTIRVKYALHLQSVKSKLRENFQCLVKFGEKIFPNAACASIKVSKDVSQLQDTVQALFQSKYDATELCDFLMEKCLTAIITKPVKVSVDSESSEYLTLQISYSTNNIGNAKNDYKLVFENIKHLFQSLENLNVLVSSDHHVFGIIGEHLSNRWLKLLIDECLMNAIPDTVEDYDTSTLVQDVLQLEHFLVDSFLIPKELEQQLTKFTERYETLFFNRFSRLILDSGKEIMQKEMQEMTVMAEKNTPEIVANNPILFPRCMVSKNVLEFVKLLNRILRQGSESTNNENRFLSIITVLINSYVTLVPQLHKDKLEALPQHVALFYNNCMFLHHWVAKNFTIPTVPNIVKILSTTANRYLMQEVNKQQAILQEILQPNEGAKALSTATIHDSLRHLKLLESLWQPLPLNVYNKSMGDLISSCCLLLNQSVLDKEGITEMEIKTTSNTLDLFQNGAKSLLKDDLELSNIINWQRLLYLLKIIKASLAELVEMWSTDEMKLYFKADEVVRLMRSLYPNNERRALALKKIF